MPHQCTTCGRTFPDGSKRMLSGCPDCGGNKFQFLPPDAEASDTDQPGAAESPAQSSPDATAVREDDGGTRATSAPAPEDHAQASARRAFVSEDELPPIDGEATTGTEGSSPDVDADRPALDQLRAELNDQFESIKILRPGEYELNLMELYDRDEYIVALEEDGRYVIDVPNSWHDE